MTEWWQTFFTGLWEQAQLAMWSAEDNRAAADKVERALDLAAASKVLDVPCGDGRIAVELASEGHEVTGVDLNETFLGTAARKAEQRSVNVEWLRLDMRELAFDSDFDAAINFGGSFGYFDDEGNERTAAGIYRALRPGGRFLVDMPSPETIFPRFRDRFWSPAGDLLVLTENRWDAETGRNEADWTIVGVDGKREHRHSSIRLYTVPELSALLTGVGFTHVQAFDAESLGPFQIGASRLIAVAAK
jgi:SAM-dependent methyltransferase